MYKVKRKYFLNWLSYESIFRLFDAIILLEFHTLQYLNIWTSKEDYQLDLYLSAYTNGFEEYAMHVTKP